MIPIDPGADAADVQARENAKLDDVNDKIRRLQHIRRALETVIATCPGRGGLGCCSIMEALNGDAPTKGGGNQTDDSKRKRS